MDRLVRIATAVAGSRRVAGRARLPASRQHADPWGKHPSHRAITAASGDPLYEAIEINLKGPEVHLSDISYADNEGNCRDKARIRWWDQSATTVTTAAVLPGGSTSCDGSPLHDSPPQLDFLLADNVDTPVLYGHYWRNGTNPKIDDTRSACLDWSIAKRGQLVAYRWNGKQDRTNDHFPAVRRTTGMDYPTPGSSQGPIADGQ